MPKRRRERGGPGEDRLKALISGVKPPEGAETPPKLEEAAEEGAIDLRSAVEEGLRNPVICINYPLVSALMRVLASRDPNFRRSRLIKATLEEGLRARYPDLWRALEEELVAVKGERALRRMKGE
ncbi:MAG: hypothetical protein QI223_08055 [Candidatus Korarchaeota archaeon]|nr:hypothetical protein [Candidatus Korarchaeota archaeon]